MTGGTVKQFFDALDEMKAIYPYKDEETILSTRNPFSMADDCLTIVTTDEVTGIRIEMSKQLER